MRPTSAGSVTHVLLLLLLLLILSSSPITFCSAALIDGTPSCTVARIGSDTVFDAAEWKVEYSWNSFNYRLNTVYHGQPLILNLLEGVNATYETIVTFPSTQSRRVSVASSAGSRWSLTSNNVVLAQKRFFSTANEWAVIFPAGSQTVRFTFETNDFTTKLTVSLNAKEKIFPAPLLPDLWITQVVYLAGNEAFIASDLANASSSSSAVTVSLEGSNYDWNKTALVLNTDHAVCWRIVVSDRSETPRAIFVMQTDSPTCIIIEQCGACTNTSSTTASTPVYLEETESLNSNGPIAWYPPQWSFGTAPVVYFSYTYYLPLSIWVNETAKKKYGSTLCATDGSDAPSSAPTSISTPSTLAPSIPPNACSNSNEQQKASGSSASCGGKNEPADNDLYYVVAIAIVVLGVIANVIVVSLYLTRRRDDAKRLWELRNPTTGEARLQRRGDGRGRGVAVGDDEAQGDEELQPRQAEETFEN